MRIIDQLQVHALELLNLLSQAPDLENVDTDSLKRCGRVLLTVLETLSLVYAKHPATIQAARWNDLSPVEAAKRIIFLFGRPAGATEILEELKKRGWKRPSMMNVNALCVAVDHAQRHVTKVDFNKWELTPAALLEQRALAIFSLVEDSDPEVLSLLSDSPRRQVRMNRRWRR